MSTCRARRSLNCWGWSWPEHRPAHVHRGHGRAPGARPAGTRRSAPRPGWHTVNDGGVTRPASTAAWARQRMPFPLISATLPSALLQLHGQVGAVPSPSEDPDHPVGTRPRTGGRRGPAPDPAWQRARRSSEVHQDQKVVAGPVVLGQVQGSAVGQGVGLMASADQSPTPAPPPGSRPNRRRDRSHRVVLRVQPHDPGIAPEPGHLPPGEGPGTPDGLVDGLGQRHPVFQVGQELPVAEGLAGRPGQPAGSGGQAPHLVEQTPASIRRSNRSAIRRSVSAGSGPDPDQRHRGRRVALQAGPERGERPARPQGHLQGPDQAATVGGLDRDRPPPGRAGPAGAWSAGERPLALGSLPRGRRRRARARGDRPPAG